MFILNLADIKYCQVISVTSETPQILDAIYYQDKFFTRGESFSLSDGAEALEKRYDVLDNEKVEVVFVQELFQITVYYLNSKVRWIPSIQADILNNDNNRQNRLTFRQKIRQAVQKEICVTPQKQRNTIREQYYQNDWTIQSVHA